MLTEDGEKGKLIKTTYILGERETMLRIDQDILNVNGAIYDNISHFKADKRGLLSQNILAQTRNFVEYIAIKIYAGGSDADSNDYDFRKKALESMKQRNELKFLDRFHRLLQKSVSHYTMDPDGAERLMLKYYEYLLKIKLYLKETYDLEVLENIEAFPLNTDHEKEDYYKKIAERMEQPSPHSRVVAYNDRCYIQKIKPFFIDRKIYYEVTFTAAMANASKIEWTTAFTSMEIMDNYAVKFSLREDVIRIFNKDIPIRIIDQYEISIRPCEWENFSKFFGPPISCSTNSTEYKGLMNFIAASKMPLSELVSGEQNFYDSVKKQIIAKPQSTPLYDVLDECRKIIIPKKKGSNVLRYLLHNMNNRIIKSQYQVWKCRTLSNLYLRHGCIPFDQMPYCTSLCRHNPRIYDLLESIPIHNREHELFARYIKNNIEKGKCLFNHRKDLEAFENIDQLIEVYNNSLYREHSARQLKEYKQHIYIEQYADDCRAIIERLQALSSRGFARHTCEADAWLSLGEYVIDDPEKKEILRQLFASSKVALLYGSAGTGKTRLIHYAANLRNDKKKIFLANTHVAVDNMRRKVKADHCTYCTIKTFLAGKAWRAKYDTLFIDECSTVSNQDMRSILEKAKFSRLVLAGDCYQIEAIHFGNWFSLAQKFVPATAVFELKQSYRTENKHMLTIWKRVRELDDSILETLVKNHYTARLDESIFKPGDQDEIILCLHYDGLYGINTINRFLQQNNPNEPVVWDVSTYKVGDPILFNEANIFSPLIHNNTKGRLVGIHRGEKQIRFEAELEKSITADEAKGYPFKLLGESESGRSIISFNVNKFRSTDEDEGNDSTAVPFQVAYAVSIHKAQGLEYNSVKIVITNESEARITHDIFYTAITRAKNKLKIYWSPETEKAVLERLKIRNSNKDAYLLAQVKALSLANQA